jgi:hypothetical protein
VGQAEHDAALAALKDPAGQVMQARLVVDEHVCRNMPALHEAGAAAQSEQGAAPVAE